MNQEQPSQYQQSQKYLFPTTFIFLIFLNLFFSSIIRYNQYFYIPNKFIFNLPLNIFSITLIVLFTTYGFWQFKFIKTYPIISGLVLGGAWSNLIERYIFGNVADYLPLILSHINLADIQ
ncbi:hypothetical protein HC766_03390, partial [Candidatus Gracilibacteria bacterium]|nr:hypothetical protein [Candidatus Gracilibacteria bacterium]